MAGFRQNIPRRVRLRGDQPAWLICRHADVRQALNEPLLSVDDQHPNFPNRLLVPLAPRIQSFWRMDAPEHPALRRLVMPDFTAHRTKQYRPLVEAVTDQLLDGLAELTGPIDLWPAFALALPCIVIARIFGVPDEDMDEFRTHTGELLNQEQPEKAMAAYEATTSYLRHLARSRAKAPRDDLMSRLVNGRVAGDPINEDDLVAMVRLMLVAGHETTASQLALSLFTLLDRPELKTTVLEHPERIGDLVEELLRYWSIPQDNVVRVAKGDVRIGGALIADGDAVLISIPSANHDDEVFPAADRFDLDRDSRAHLAFGYGAHHCPGASLARQEMEVALPAIFRRFPDLRLAVPSAEVPFRLNTLVYGLEALPVLL
ncbi:cytochrome P450 [Actinokineospora sp. NBRC 105648]|uniref:cytochrome P450 n=1 Tax=Actinokineospora sp. NBRC 105648 TaxID=3032206 RepID=UPI0024A19EC7|nr:cytochrome P450 [Actinokineospora sp. NBRC 105648]GLZ40735.1 cytochrome P450 [Actinokineospora sp. NBRC 105648]